jgi:hypothetical protein
MAWQFMVTTPAWEKDWKSRTQSEAGTIRQDRYQVVQAALGINGSV